MFTWHLMGLFVYQNELRNAEHAGWPITGLDRYMCFYTKHTITYVYILVISRSILPEYVNT